MFRYRVLLLIIPIILMVSGCTSQDGGSIMPGTVPNRNGASVDGNNGTAGTDEANGPLNGNGKDNSKGQAQGQETVAADSSRNAGAGGESGQTRQTGQNGQNSQTGQTGQNGQNSQTGQNASNRDIEATVAKTLDSLSTEEKIGQMFIVGFDGTEPGTDISEMIKKRFIGGVILFQRNVTDPGRLLELNNSLKLRNKANKVPLIISVDEEGGRVSRMPEQLRDMPAALTIGSTGKSEQAFGAGAVLADEISAFGFNTDFAPVLDIWSNPQNTVIGDRAFGTTPDIVSSMGIVAMKGIRGRGIIPVVKHFPGHGDTAVDSHAGLPKVDYGIDRLNRFELVPFRAAINEGADAIMVAHILMSALDRKYPASLSKPVITDLLRRDMGFDGVVITDDMTMGAIAKNYEIGYASVRAVLAGSDIVLVCHGTDSQRRAMDSVKAAVNNGTIPIARINESVHRILLLKYKYKLSDKTIKSVNVDDLNKKIDAVLTE